MKTFKLKALKIIENKDQDIVEKVIPLHDGLIIDREDDENQWVIEAYFADTYWDYFNHLKEQNAEVMIQVKITKKSNEPASFITSIIGMNDIGSRMNILFKGVIMDHPKSEIEVRLKALIEAGHQGSQLLSELKSSFTDQ